MKNMGKKNFKQGDVFLVKVEYKQAGTTKIRPVVIVSNDKAIDIDMIIAPVTGQAARNEFDVPIIKWKEAGLEKPSVARASKIMMIHNSVLFKRIGELQSEDLENVLRKCRECF